jgi:RHS repeat-associated protein
MKKTNTKILLVAAACYLSSPASAQNAPNGALVPPGTPATFTAPKALNVSPNTAPTVYNYQRVWTPTVPITNAAGPQFSLGTTNTVHTTTNYTDGNGEDIMTIEHSPGSSTKSVISPFDNRPSLTRNTYLPYLQSNTLQRMSDNLAPFTSQDNYYFTNYNSEGHTALSQSVASFPSGVPTITNYTAGSSFVGQGRGTTITTGYNVANDIVQYSYDANTLTGFGTYYAANSLTLKTTTGQNGTVVKEYYDKNNRLICKKVYDGHDKTGNPIWLVTNYVYTSFGKLGCILTPKASQFTSMATGLMNYCYTYTYGRYDNIIAKTTPDKVGTEYIVYDTKERPVLYQSPLLASQGKWQFTIYDSRDNVIMKGYITDADNRATWQDWVYGGTTVTPPSSVTPLLNYLINGFSGAYPSSITSCDIRLYNYYDTYTGDPSFSGRSFDASNASLYSTDASAVAPNAYTFTQDMLTASRVKVVDPSSVGGFANSWITNVFFYDQKGELIQTQTLNPWNTSYWDETTNQYNFRGQKILDITDHHAYATSTKPETKIINTYFYDSYYGRLLYTQQKADSGTYRTIASYTYDDLGRISVKSLGGIEVQNYAYNIRSQLASINADHIISPTVPDETFGEILNYDYGFSKPRYDGSLAGIQWRGAGSELTGSYGYDYDTVGRLISANYNQYSTSWNKSTTDYSMLNASYDVNGNMLTMSHMGVTGSGIALIDKLAYTYNTNSNQLQSVSDAVKTNYGLGDFQDGSGSGADYSYDVNGNMTADANKGVTSITYSELNKPLVVTFSSGSTITYLYDASGNLLFKKVNDVSKPSPDIYRYWGPFNYHNDSLAYVLHSEGRARWLNDSLIFKYDFFVKDHLGNVREVLTSDEGNPADYFAGHELAAAALESSIFANVDAVRDTKPSSTNPYDVEAAHLDGSDPSRRIGTALLMSVMAGDKFDISATSYFSSDSVNMQSAVDPNSMMNAITSSLVNGVGGYNQEATNVSAVNTMFSSGNYLGMYQSILDSLSDYSRPLAYINYQVFDAQMNLLPSESGALQVSGTPDSWQGIATAGPLPIKQNGFVAIYMSDADYMPVYMDKLDVTYYRGRLLQEQHYYPFGLAINQTVAAGSDSTRYLYQGNKLQPELGLNLSDFHARQYDAQLGRFTGIDPMDQFASGYTGQGNDPANLIDPLGLQANSPYGQGDAPPAATNSPVSLGYLDPVANLPHNVIVTHFDPDGTITGSEMVEVVPGEGLNHFVQNYNDGQRSGRITSRMTYDHVTGQWGYEYPISTYVPNPPKEIYGSTNLTYYTHYEYGVGWHYYDANEDQNNNSSSALEKTSKVMDVTALGTDFHGLSLAAVGTFAKEAYAPVKNYARGVGAIGSIATIASVGIHVYQGKADWKDGVSGTLATANLVLIAIPGIGEAVAGLELTVAAGTLLWDAWNTYESNHK